MEKKGNLFAKVAVCLLPMILGAAFYNRLPEQMAVHFTLGGEPNSYAPKNFALFGLPLAAAALQTICVICMRCATKANKRQGGKTPKIIKIVEWIIPVVTCAVYTIMLRFSLTGAVRVGKNVCAVVGVLLIVVGNYLPKMSWEDAKAVMHPSPESEKSFRKMSAAAGFLLIALGAFLLLVLAFLP